MKNLYFYIKKNNKKGHYCKWILDLRDVEKIENKKFLQHDDIKNFEKNLKLINKYNEFLFNYIYKKLNKYHDINFSKRQWRILIGKWLRYFVGSTFFRYNYLITSINKENINNFYLRFNKKNNYIPTIFIDYLYILDNQERNNYFNWKILSYVKKKINSNIKIFTQISNEKYRSNKFINTYNLKSFRYIVHKIFNFIFKPFLKNDTPIIISSYLSFFKEIILQFKIKSFFSWKYFFFNKNYEILKKIKSNKIKRKNIFKNKKYNGFEGLLISLLDDFMPTCFLENFDDIKTFVQNNIIVKNPKTIWTSNEFNTNLFFNYYVALVISKKTKYIIGQHGSAYGAVRDQFDTNEERISDRFITWGWKQNKKHAPIGIFSQLGKKNITNKVKEKKIKNIVLINTNKPHNGYFWDVQKQFLRNLNDQIIFLKNLNFSLFEKVIVRIHHADQKYLNFYASKYKSLNKKIIIDDGTKKIEEYLNEETFIVFSYLSTGFFELASRNFYCMFFDSQSRSIYQSKFNKKLNELKKNNIFFENGEDISNYINSLSKENSLNLNCYHFKKKVYRFIKDYANLKKVSFNKILRLLNH